MDEEDEVALKQINANLPAGTQPCSEDQFEEVMNFFEETAQAKQPFAMVDSPPVLPIEELEDQYDDTTPDYVRAYAKVVYDHWRSRRSATGNRGLSPSLKFETGQDTDDSDPYVCFRRRELRQIRKTRNRDAQSAEKLRKLRFELEAARNVLLMVKRREQFRKEQLEIDRLVFEQRLTFKETKRKLGIKTDDELLVNQKKQKQQAAAGSNQQALAQQLRIPVGGSSPATDLRTLEDVKAEKQKGIDNEIDINIQKHIRWNEGFVDKTKAPLTPISEKDVSEKEGQYRQAMPATTYLPTPPASVSEGTSPPGSHEPPVAQSTETHDVEMKDLSRSSTPFRYASPAEDDVPERFPSFRRRVGRGGRVVIDRRAARKKGRFADDDRFKYDTDNDSEVEEPDPAAIEDTIFARMAQRAYLFSRPGSEQQPQTARRPTIEGPGSSQSPASAPPPQLQITAPT